MFNRHLIKNRLLNKMNKNRPLAVLGVAFPHHKEYVVASVGAGLSIFLICCVGSWINEVMLKHLQVFTNSYVLISIAASAVLLFALPHGALSQPWPLVAGHGLCAVVGVTCYQVVDSELIAAPVAVGLSILLMSYFKCVHPPGGATALGAVLGGDSIHSLGYFYLLFPVLFGGLFMLLLAVAYNYPFKWRQYPAHLFYRRGNKLGAHQAAQLDVAISHEDMYAAIQQHQVGKNLTEDGLVELMEAAKQYAQMGVGPQQKLTPGRYYSNGQVGRNWSVRQVLVLRPRRLLGAWGGRTIVYCVVAGDNPGANGLCRLEEFSRWAKFEVYPSDDGWVKTALHVPATSTNRVSS